MPLSWNSRYLTEAQLETLQSGESRETLGESENMEGLEGGDNTKKRQGQVNELMCVFKTR